MSRAAFVIVLALAAPAAAQVSPEPREIAIEDPSGHALDAFHAALRRARDGQGRARITMWGASHVASDQYPGFLREAWQRRFGDAGPGFVTPALPFLLYAHQRATVAPEGRWRVARVHGRDRPRAAYGPAGLALDTTRAAHAFVELARAAAPIDRVAVYFARQRGGGSFDVALGDVTQRVETEGEGIDVVVREGAARRVDIRAHGDGPVRIFGVSLERDHAGVIVDSLGIPGSRMRDRLPWDDAALRAQVRELAPDLIVLAYGTNEAGFTGRSIARYRREVDEAVRRAREAAPGASCLLIGPSDRPMRSDDGAWVPRPRTMEVANVQREIARARGCGFFDLVALQGGPGSMPRWVDAGLALSDYVHFTDEGHRIIARILSRALLRGL